MLATSLSRSRHGVGRTLITTAEELAYEKGFKEIEIEIRTFPIIARIPEIAPLQKKSYVSAVSRKKAKLKEAQ